MAKQTNKTKRTDMISTTTQTEIQNVLHSMADRFCGDELPDNCYNLRVVNSVKRSTRSGNHMFHTANDLISMTDGSIMLNMDVELSSIVGGKRNLGIQLLDVLVHFLGAYRAAQGTGKATVSANGRHNEAHLETGRELGVHYKKNGSLGYTEVDYVETKTQTAVDQIMSRVNPVIFEYIEEDWLRWKTSKNATDEVAEDEDGTGSENGKGKNGKKDRAKKNSRTHAVGCDCWQLPVLQTENTAAAMAEALNEKFGVCMDCGKSFRAKLMEEQAEAPAEDKTATAPVQEPEQAAPEAAEAAEAAEAGDFVNIEATEQEPELKKASGF